MKELQRSINDLIADGPEPSFVGRFIKPANTFVLSRGSPESPRDEVFSAGLSELGGDLGIPNDAAGVVRRSAFARWLTGPENPLTARVAVNRLWHHVFGRGIVSTPGDFGVAGAAPTHPELLDWLAAELKAPTQHTSHSSALPWTMKRMVRIMVMSRAFRQSSQPRQTAIAVDAGSTLLWRFPPRRVEAEVIRDSVLRASGCLDTTVGGKSYRIHNVKKRYAQWQVTDNHGPATWRRMIYQERMRRVDDGMFTAFDFPDCGQIQARRPVSTTPLQALNLMNSKFVLDQSDRIAKRALLDSREDESKLPPSTDASNSVLRSKLPIRLNGHDACQGTHVGTVSSRHWSVVRSSTPTNSHFLPNALVKIMSESPKRLSMHWDGVCSIVAVSLKNGRPLSG